MKILLGHCYYRSTAPSGEDAVYDNEKALLKKNGHGVIPFELQNDDICDDTFRGRMRIGLETVWSRTAARRIEAVLDREQPDVAHFHNTFPQLSPSVYLACQKKGVPVLQTLHNYRLICPAALLLRNGTPCEDCVGKIPVPAVLHRCYRDSLPATTALAAMIARAKLFGTYSKAVDRYIALTEFAKSRFIMGGIPANRIIVKPNFLPAAPDPGQGLGGYAVYVGRLSAEKGVLTLLRAWRDLPDLPLKIVGDGPLMQQCRETVTREGLPVEFSGQLDRDKVLKVVSGSVLQVIPSEWYEGFPMVMLEAMASGTPLVAAKIGSLDEIVADKPYARQFTPGDANSLVQSIKDLLRSSCRSLRCAARKDFDDNYTSAANYTRLLAIYEGLLSSKSVYASQEA